MVIYSPHASSHPTAIFSLPFVIYFQYQYSHYSVPECWCVSTCPPSGKSSPDPTKSAPLSRGATLWWRRRKKSQCKSKWSLLGGAELRCLPHLTHFFFFSAPVAFVSSRFTVTPRLPRNNVVLNESILLPVWVLSLLGFSDTLELIFGWRTDTSVFSE